MKKPQGKKPNKGGNKAGGVKKQGPPQFGGKKRNDLPFNKSRKDAPFTPTSGPIAEMNAKRKQEAVAKEKLRQERIESLLASGVGTREQIEAELDFEDQQSNSQKLSMLLQNAENAGRAFEGGRTDMDDVMDEDNSDDEIPIEIEENDSKDSSRKAFDKIYKQVVENSDVILYVLDARDPEGTRSRQVEHTVLASPDKRLLFVLNKIDLVPPEVLKKWHSVLKLSFPTIPLAASSSAPNAQTFIHKGLTQVSTSTALLQALKAYAHASQLKRSISVGVIGYPNVGKSSVINSLIARHGQVKRACPVGAQAGVTTSIRQVKVDNKLKVLDSPGIVFPSAEGKHGKKVVDEQSRLILLNALPPKQIDDPVPAVSLLLKRLCKNPELKDRLCATYEIPNNMSETVKDMVTDFLVFIARKKGRLLKGGIPDMNAAATAVITDWRDGRLAGWTLPKTNTATILETAAPIGGSTSELVLDKSESGRPEEKVVVTEWAKEFSLEGLWDGNFGEEEADVEMS